MEPIRLYLIHGHPLLIEAVARTFTHWDQLKLVGTARDVDEAEGFDRAKPDLVLLDASVDRSRALRWTQRCRELLPAVKPVPLGLPSEDDALAFIEAGASGYVLRRHSLADLVRTIVAVHADRPPCSGSLAASICARISELATRRQARVGNGSKLTPREGQVIELVATGLRNKEIAQRLEITLPTVKNHVHNILEKLQAKSRREATIKAYESGLLTRAPRGR